MNNFEVEIWDDEGRKCTLYSVVKDSSGEEEEEPLSETDIFFDTYAAENSSYSQEANELLMLLTGAIADKYGAMDYFFDRLENNAQALPPKPKNNPSEIKILGINFPLRLYCYRVSPLIVVLFNGGVKTSNVVQDSPDLHMKFQEAQIFAKKIAGAIREGIITISACGRYLEDFSGNEQLILY